MTKKRVVLEVGALQPSEFSEKAVEAFARAVEGRGRFYSVDELRED